VKALTRAEVLQSRELNIINAQAIDIEWFTTISLTRAGIFAALQCQPVMRVII